MATPGLNVFADADGEWRWQAVAANGRIVATGAEGYHNRDDCVHGASVACDILRHAADLAVESQRLDRDARIALQIAERDVLHEVPDAPTIGEHDDEQQS